MQPMDPKKLVAIKIRAAKARGAAPMVAPAGDPGRFASLKAKLAKNPNVRSPGGLAAFIGKQQYGKEPTSPFKK